MLLKSVLICLLILAATTQVVSSAKPQQCTSDKDCNQGYICNQGKCIVDNNYCPETDDNPCTKDMKIRGKCTNVPLSLIPCDDGNACTQKDVCVLGKCTGKDPITCDPTTPTCDPTDGSCSCTATSCPEGYVCNDNGNCIEDPCYGVFCIPTQCYTGGTCFEGQCHYDPEPGAGCNDRNDCTGDGTCSAEGYCEPGAPLEPGTPCGEEGGICCSGQCIDTKSDPNNCGGCGKVCEAGKSCCNSECTNTQTDPRNCGDCGQDCGSCDNACCSGECQDIHSNANCGSCGNACQAGTSCCGSGCVNFQSDTYNCGYCGHDCTVELDNDDAKCVDGTCSIPTGP